MEYKNLKEINEKLKTIPVKGKNYVEVNERIKAFWELCPEGRIETQIYEIENGICVIQASVYENKADEFPRATGTAYEKENSTFINKTSYIENCETSAVGRALGNAGIGIDISIASAEEVQNAIIQQDGDNKLDKIKLDLLNQAIKEKHIQEDVVELILSGYGYKTIADIKVKDYMNIVNDFKEKLEKEDK